MEDVLACNAALPDYIGFVFAPSRRQIGIAQAAQLKQALDPRIKAVGVFVNASLDEIAQASEHLDLIQLHGSESDDFVRQAKDLYSLPMVKLNDSEFADFALFDGPNPGSGKAFDWRAISCYNKKYFLAGGLLIENIEQAAKLKPYCLDVSSGVETNGVKDAAKIQQFVTKARML